MKYILTLLQTLKKSAIKELKSMDADISIKELDSCIFLVETQKSEFKDMLKKSIFIRHMHPVNKEVSIKKEKELDLKQIFSSIISFVDINNKMFMVQCRKIGKELPYNSKDIEVFIGSKLEELGGTAMFDDKKIISDPKIHIISILILENQAYLGFSKINENLEPYSNPARIYGKWENTICRAEFKLVEAIRKFGIKLKKGMNALDIGAAPGGWSKILKDNGLNVIAIDPAPLDKRLQGIEHFKGKAEEFTTSEKFDILVNDMNQDLRDSARVTVSMKKFLKKGAKVVFTAKLVYKNYDKLILETKQIFEKDFNLIAIKNLFHNHEEVTFYLELKN